MNTDRVSVCGLQKLKDQAILRIKGRLAACVWLVGLVMTGSAAAAPVGLVAIDNSDDLAQELGLSVCDVFVDLDQPQDNLLAVDFWEVITDDPAGYYQHEFGADTAPSAGLCAAYPELCLDSFVTIGVSDADAGDDTLIGPGWDSEMFNLFGTAVGSILNANPENGQGLPNADGLTLIGQFTVHQGHTLGGAVTVHVQDPLGNLISMDLSFIHESVPAIGACCNGETCLNGISETECTAMGGTHSGDGSTCPLLSGEDCNANGEDDAIDIYCGNSIDDDGNGVPDECTSEVLGACCSGLTCMDGIYEAECAAMGGTHSGDGSTCPSLNGEDCNANGEDDAIDLYCGNSSDNDGDGIPDECEPGCFGDVNDDNIVNVVDLLAVLAGWGPCQPPANCPADLDGDGTIGVLDLLQLLAGWGDCA